MAEKYHTNFRYFEDGTIGISIDETIGVEDANTILKIFESFTEKVQGINSAVQIVNCQLPTAICASTNFTILNASRFQYPSQRKPDDALHQTTGK